MTDERLSAIDRFLQGELTLPDLEAALRAELAADPAAAPAVAGHLDALYQQGRLPLQIHGMLRSLLPAEGAPDRTVPRPVAQTPSASGDPTRIKPAAIDQTRRRPPEPRVGDATRVRDAQTRSPEVPSVTRPPTGTGSNWAHPEQWTPRHEGPLGPGSVIGRDGRFVIESLLGQGGMGAVYKTFDRRKEEARDRNPYIAMKILNEEFRRHPDSLVALQREAVKAQTLAHPNIITVHDFDRDGTTVYMTMELLEGETLNKLISRHKFGGVPKERAVPVIRAMAEALAYAHKKGIVHSDLKPGNVFLTTAEEVKVLDFGIARAVVTELKPDADKTVFDAGSLGALTPAYASAEMLRGAAPAPADDVYALGVIAYELLTGRHPYDREPADSARLRGLVPAPVPGITRRQHRALKKALNLDRADRQADARIFLREFDGPTPIRRSVYAAMLVLLVLLGYAIYVNMQIRPDVPFETLSAEEQQRFLDAVANGEEALDIDLAGALDYYSTAYDIHRNNPAAIAGLQTVARRTLDAIEANDRGLQERAVATLLCQEYLSTYGPVVDACEAMLGAERCEAQAARCSAGGSE